LRRLARAECDNRWANWSRSYTPGAALVVGWNARVGADLETPARATQGWSLDDPAFRKAILSPEERCTFTEDDTRVGATRLWSAKEALAKALGDAKAYEPSRLSGPAAWTRGRRGRFASVEFGPREVGAGRLGWIVYEVVPVGTNGAKEIAVDTGFIGPQITRRGSAPANL
jgi:hypothetical protein